MKKENLIKKLQKVNSKLENNSFTLNEKEIDVKFQGGEVLFYSYNNYDSPILFYSLNQIFRHFQS